METLKGDFGIDRTAARFFCLKTKQSGIWKKEDVAENILGVTAFPKPPSTNTSFSYGFR